MSQEKLQRIKEAFPNPVVYDRIAGSLRSGKPYPARESGSATKDAYRQSVEIKLVEQP